MNFYRNYSLLFSTGSKLLLPPFMGRLIVLFMLLLFHVIST